MSARTQQRGSFASEAHNCLTVSHRPTWPTVIHPFGCTAGASLVPLAQKQLPISYRNGICSHQHHNWLHLLIRQVTITSQSRGMLDSLLWSESYTTYRRICHSILVPDQVWWSARRPVIWIASLSSTGSGGVITPALCTAMTMDVCYRVWASMARREFWQGGCRCGYPGRCQATVLRTCFSWTLDTPVT